MSDRYKRCTECIQYICIYMYIKVYKISKMKYSLELVGWNENKLRTQALLLLCCTKSAEQAHSRIITETNEESCTQLNSRHKGLTHVGLQRLPPSPQKVESRFIFLVFVRRNDLEAPKQNHKVDLLDFFLFSLFSRNEGQLAHGLREETHAGFSKRNTDSKRVSLSIGLWASGFRRRSRAFARSTNKNSTTLNYIENYRLDYKIPTTNWAPPIEETNVY